LCSFSSEIVMFYLEVLNFRGDCLELRRDLLDEGVVRKAKCKEIVLRMGCKAGKRVEGGRTAAR
jgi:hypothetical protein